MKKQFSLVSPNKKPERQVEAVKYEIKKYIAREKRKDLPEGYDFWDFDCRFGEAQEEAQVIKVSQINGMIDQIVQASKDSFYLEVLAKASRKTVKKFK